MENTNLEQLLFAFDLRQRNLATLYAMQIAYLNSYNACQLYGISKEEYQNYFLFSIHGREE